jgi:hypothetical protein
VTTVRIARAEPRPGRQPDGSVVIGRFLVVLADDDARRALPLWLQVPGGGSLWRLLDRPGADPVMAGVLEETAARLLDAAAVTVTAVDLETAGADAEKLGSDTVTARIGLAVAGGTREVTVSAAEGRSAVLASTVPEPHGFAVLVQTILADDYGGRTVTLRGELRTQDVAGHAGLHLAAGHPLEPPGAHLRERGARSLTSPGSSDWARHEVTMHPTSADGLPSADDLDRADALGRAVADLPPGQRRAVTLFYYADLPADQIARTPAQPRPACTRPAAGCAAASPSTGPTSSPPPGEPR